MKKSIVGVLMILFLLSFQLDLSVLAEDDSYLTYNEIMMVSGKLLANFTEEEYEQYYKNIAGNRFWGVNAYVVHQNVAASYISSTLYSVENRGNSDITYELDIVVETANKTTWNVSGSLGGSAKGTIKSFKTELSAKVGVEYNQTTTASRKETQKMKIIIEKQSRAIVYLMGTARITNGVCSCYKFWIGLGKGGFEYFTLVNQYPRMEKRAL